ncbi:GNAT family N-acetyltransferase [Paenibacillus marinisediminis]
MSELIPSIRLLQHIEDSEIDYMNNRMLAIMNRNGNPEGVEVARFGHTICLYSRTMPWPAFNTVKGLCSADLEHLDSIIEFYRSRNRKIQFELVPGLADHHVLKSLADRGFYQSGYHASLYREPIEFSLEPNEHITVRELQEDELELYAAIHCRGFGLGDDGIASVAQNNIVLFLQDQWKYYVAEWNGEPAAVGVMYINNGIASLTSAATLPQYRNNGLQRRLLMRRIEEAYRHHCVMVVSQCALSTQSHRNMEHVGMRIGYVRATWTDLTY